MSAGVNINSFTKYHFGCKENFVRDYLNIDFWPQLAPGVLYKDPNGVKETYLLNHDLSRNIPAEDGTIDVIYHYHFIEELTYEQSWEFFQKCFAKMKHGGIHRIVVSDLELWLKAYVWKDNFIFDKFRQEFLSSNIQKYNTRVSVFMEMLKKPDHKSWWDFETLEYVLKQSGFRSIKKVMIHESELKEIKNIELNAPFQTLESLCVECKK
jgi:hypothetical protein